MKLSIWWPTYGNFIRMGGATSFPYPALPSRFKSLLNAIGSRVSGSGVMSPDQEWNRIKSAARNKNGLSIDLSYDATSSTEYHTGTRILSNTQTLTYLIMYNIYLIIIITEIYCWPLAKEKQKYGLQSAIYWRIFLCNQCI